MNRRDFIRNSGLTIAGIGLSGLAMPTVFAQGSPNKKIVVAVMGVNGRGNYLSKVFAKMPDCEVAYICDVDQRVMTKTIGEVSAIQTRKPTAEKDFRKALEDKGVDALVVAAPDHWHASAAIAACSAGKHVYVEKPLSHNPNEGELLVQAARKNKRIVQMGSQHRSGSGIQQMVADIKSGLIGNAYMARAWYTNNRGPMQLKNAAVPTWLDYDLWQGPAPRKPYQSGLIHYNWHWRWHWGAGEVLNNGTHELDIARWGLRVEFPSRVSSSGGRYSFKDDWETPDTQTISIEFPENRLIVWESRSCNNFKEDGFDRGVTFYGDNGTIVCHGDSYTVYDKSLKAVKSFKNAAAESQGTGKETGKGTGKETTGKGGAKLDELHIANFLDCIRTGNAPVAECEIGHRSTLLGQLGNISLRTKQMLEIDPKSGRIVNNPAAQQLWSREYEKGWELRV